MNGSESNLMLPIYTHPDEGKKEAEQVSHFPATFLCHFGFAYSTHNEKRRRSNDEQESWLLFPSIHFSLYLGVTSQGNHKIGSNVGKDLNISRSKGLTNIHDHHTQINLSQYQRDDHCQGKLNAHNG